jgi:hypothetical protein
MSKAVKGLGSTLTGGLLGGADKPKINVYKEPEKPTVKKSSVDPNRPAQLAEARKRRALAASKIGKASLRNDLDGGQSTRGGISIS